MRTKTERTRGVTLTLLSLDDLEEAALEKYNQHRAIDGDKPATAMRLGWSPYAAAEKDGHLYVVNHEGIGYEVTDDDPLSLDLYPSWEKSFGIMPTMSATLSPEEVKSRMTGEQIDLADLVRSFGQRLEDNFWANYRAMA